MVLLFDISSGILEHFVIDKYRPSGKYVGTIALEKVFLNLASSCWDHSATCDQDPPRDLTFVQFPLWQVLKHSQTHLYRMKGNETMKDVKGEKAGIETKESWFGKYLNHLWIQTLGNEQVILPAHS